MPKPTYKEYISAYTEVLKAYYGETRIELYPDDADESPYKEVSSAQMVSAISEKFGYLAILGETIESFERLLEATDLDFEDDNGIAFTVIKNAIEGIEQLSAEEKYIDNLEKSLTDSFDYRDFFALHSGHELGIKTINERVDDFLEMCPLEEKNLTQEINSLQPKPTL